MTSDRLNTFLRSLTRRPWTWWLGRIALTAYLITLVVYIIRVGLPTDRIDQTIWILAGITAVKLGRPWREHVRAIVDWLPLLGALLLYDYTRGIADTLGMPTRVAELVDAERLLFGDQVPTAWLQERFFTPGEPHWWDVIASGVYMSHFVLPWAVAAAFYMASRPLWWRYIRAVLVLSYAGLLTYILVPAAPPWYAGLSGLIDGGVERSISAGWSAIGLQFAGAWLEREQALVNDVAALPSLHAAFALLVSVALWPLVRHWLPRILLAAFPVAMGLTLVYSGEHYMVDVLLGWVYVGLILLGLRAWDRWWAEPSTGAADLTEEVRSPAGVLGPDEEPVAPQSAAAVGFGERAPNARVEEHVLEDLEIGRGDSRRDRYE